MKKLVFTTIFSFISLLLVITPAQAVSLSQRLSGKILLQIQEHGEAWYIYPDDLKRYYLGRPADAFSVMRELGLGISEASYDSFNGYAPSRLSGKILLRVEANGEAYYVNPVDLKMHYLGRPADAFQVMRELGLGITNADLDEIKEPEAPVKIEQEQVIIGYIRDCSFRVGENVSVPAEITYDNTLVSTSNDGYFSIKAEGDPELLITAGGYHDYIETPSRMVNNAFYLIPDDVYQDLYSVVWEEQINNPNNWMRKWTRQPEIIIAKEEGSDGQVNTVVSALTSDVFNKMTGGLYLSENITILDELPEELYETKNRDGKIIIYFANEMIGGGIVAMGGSAYAADDENGNITFGEVVWKPSDNFNKYNVLHELTHAITTGGHINYKASIVSEVETTHHYEPTEADYKFLNCIYNSPLKRSN